MEFKTDWDKSKKRFEALWNRELVDRCCISVKGWKNFQSYKPTPDPEIKEELERHWLDAEYILKRELNIFEHTYFGGESFPMLWVNLGPGSHAASFKGVDYQFRKESVWFSPIPDEQGLNIEEDKNSFIEQKTYELSQYFVDESRNRYFVAMPDSCSDLDALAHIRSSEKLLLDMLLNPDEVFKALAKLKIVWERIFKKCNDITKNCNEGGGAFYWLDTWAPGSLMQMQIDISAMISEDMYAQFGVPELTYQSSVIDYPLYHLDGMEQIKFIDLIGSVKKLRMVQWTNVDGQPSPTEFIPALKRIQQHGKCLLVRVHTPKEAEIILKNLSSKGLYVVIDTYLDSEAEVNDVIKMAEKLTRE